MNEAVEFNEVDEVPVSAVLTVQRKSRYGSVPGLDDSELADPVELEREIMQAEWGPVLALPVQGSGSGIRPVVDESGGLDWGAFGTVDFERHRGGFDKVRYKADKLREQLKDIVIRIGIVAGRMPGGAKYVVLKYLKMGIIELKHVTDGDMWALARLYMRGWRLRKEISRLDKVSEARRQRRLAPVLV